MIRIAADGEVPVGIDSHTAHHIRGDGQEATHRVVYGYGYGNGKGKGSPGDGIGNGKGIPYSSELRDNN